MSASGLVILGYIAAVAIGLTLGLLGGGGSVLTVPVLVYLLGTGVVEATAYSLFIVGVSSSIGGISYARNGLVDVRAALVFGLPDMLMVFLTRFFLLPALPDELFHVGGKPVSKDVFLLVLFAALMLVAAVQMLRPKTPSATAARRAPVLGIAATGASVGLFTGLVGAGGGFLIVPALVGLARLPMKAAVGTSLVIISVKSLVGFSGDLIHALGPNPPFLIHWQMLLSVTGLALAGILLGARWAKRLPAATLRMGFGIFLLLMAAWMLVKELELI